MRQRRIVVLVLAASLALAGVLVSAESENDDGGGVELRIAALEDSDGSVSVGVQYRFEGEWSRTLRPARGKMPADSKIDSWRISSSVHVPIRQTRIHIEPRNTRWTDTDDFGEFVAIIDGERYIGRCGRIEVQVNGLDVSLTTGNRSCDGTQALAIAALTGKEHRGDQEMRILARRLADDRTELKVQLRRDGDWHKTQHAGTLPAVLSTTAWTVTKPLILPVAPANVTADLRNGAAISTVGTEMRAHVDGVTLDTNCGTLRMRIFSNSLLVDTVDESCIRTEALATVCSAADVDVGCDVQRNQAYAWELRHDAGIREIQLTLEEAQYLVDAIFTDYYPQVIAPRVVRSSDNSTYYSDLDKTIVLADWGLNLNVVVHELAHALVDQARAYRTGHSGAFTAILLELWERYLPLLDTEAARVDAELTALELDGEASIESVVRDGIESVRNLLCDYPAKSAALCDAFAGVMSLSGAEGGGRYVGYGNLGESLWWNAYSEEETGRFRSFVRLESRETTGDVSVARLFIECNIEDELEADIWWRNAQSLSADLSHRFGDNPWRTIRWRTLVGGGWEGDDWSVHRAIDSRKLLQEMMWFANSELPFFLRYEQGGRLFAASFTLNGVFDTPIQGNLTECGVERSASDTVGHVIDHGSFGEDFWWGVDGDADPIQSYVIKNSTIGRTQAFARLQLVCRENRIDMDILWELDADLDWTVRYRVGNRAVQTEEWMTGVSLSDEDVKWTGMKDADDLLAALFWAEQSGGTFTAQVHDRNNPDRRYTATWNLDGLFDTPVQPNLARCGR